MTKNTIIRMGTEEEITSAKQIIRKRNETYAMNMVQLQEKADLTYREARAFLVPYRENNFAMAQALGITVNAVYNLQRKAREKIGASGFTLEEIYGEYVPEERGPLLIDPFG